MKTTMVEKIVALLRGFIFELIAFMVLFYRFPGEHVYGLLLVFATSVTIRNRHDFKKMLKSVFGFGFLAGSFFWVMFALSERAGEMMLEHYYVAIVLFLYSSIMGAVIGAITLAWSVLVYYVYRKLTD